MDSMQPSSVERVDRALDAIDFSKRTQLCQIMTRFGSDKGTGPHNYTCIYDYLFADLKNTPPTDGIHIFEIGLGSTNPHIPSNMGPHGRPGASLYGWSEWFGDSASIVWGADIDQTINIQQGNIRTFYVDQTDATSIHAMWNSQDLCNVKFDIIVEDGLHEFHANKTMLLNSLHKLKPHTGMYIIEDIKTQERAKFAEWVDELNGYSNIAYAKLLDVPHPFNRLDNMMLILMTNA